EPAPAHAPQHLELSPAILPVAESERERGIEIGLGVDVRNAPGIAANRNGGGRTANAEFTGDDGKPAAEREPQQEVGKTHAAMIEEAHPGKWVGSIASV